MKIQRIMAMKDMTTTTTISTAAVAAATTTITSYTAPPMLNQSTGIGIIKFFQGKSYFITGATGFLEKALVEKILRTVPDVRKIFVLMKAINKAKAMKRLKTEIIESELFYALKQIHGKSYEAFMLSKLIPIVGNVSEQCLGMDEASVQEISEEIDIIINSAANTTLDERYDVSLFTNTRGPFQLINLAKQCKKLLVLLHVSTIYVNGEQEGVIMEKNFKIGDSLVRETYPCLDVEAEMKLAMDLRGASSQGDQESSQKLKALGMNRAKLFGRRNTYELTKAMGEMVINSTRKDIPVVVLRPSMIQSTYKEPFSGWIQGNRTMDPLLLSYGKGNLPGFLLDPESVIDVIPIDMVVNATLGAIAKHGSARKAEMTVYHVGSSMANPLLIGELFDFCRIHFASSPFVNARGEKVDVREMKCFASMGDFSSYIWREIAKQNKYFTDSFSVENHDQLQKLERKCKKLVQHPLHLAKIYEPYMFNRARFHNGNTEKLIEEMSEEEKESFGCDVRSIDWKDYISNVHIPGLRKHAMKGRGCA